MGNNVFKLVFAVRAKPGLTRAEALHHLRHKHAPLVAASHTHRMRTRTYIQNAALDAPVVPAQTADKDWVVEVWRDAGVVLPDPPTAPDAVAVREDEARFPDRATILALQVREEPVWQADPAAPFAAAPVKVFTWFRRPEGTGPDNTGADAFAQAWQRAAAGLAASAAFRRHACGFVRNRPLPGEGAPRHATASPSAAAVPPFDALDIWRLRDEAAVARLFGDAAFAGALREYEAATAAPGSVMRLVTTEHVVFDDYGVDPGGARPG